MSGDRKAPASLLQRSMDKAVSMMRLPPRDEENVCTRCGVPDVHCQCPAMEADQ